MNFHFLLIKLKYFHLTEKYWGFQRYYGGAGGEEAAHPPLIVSQHIKTVFGRNIIHDSALIMFSLVHLCLRLSEIILKTALFLLIHGLRTVLMTGER